MMRGLKAVVVALLLTSIGYCQSEQKPAATESNKAASSETPDTYRVNVVIRETQDGKPVSSRNYSTLVRDGRFLLPCTIRIGSRLPVGLTNGTQGVNYLDVGTNLTFRVWNMEGQVILRMTVEVSSIAPSDSTASVKPETTVVRQFRTDQEAAIPLGKPTLLDSVDDPNSNHKFQIEVTATKEKI